MSERLQIIISAKDQFSKSFGKLTSSLPSLKRAALGLSAAFAGTGVALAAMVKTTATAYDQIQKLSDQLGLTTEFLSSMRHAADIAGIQVRTMEKAVQMLQVRVGEVGRGMGQAKDSFEDLGVALYNTTGQLRTAEELMPDLAEAFYNMENATMRAEAASKIFGQRGMAMLQMFTQGKAGLAELTAEAERFGLVISAEAGANAAEFNDSLTRLTGSMKGIKNKIAETLLRPLSGALNALAEFMAKNRELIVRNLKDFAIASFGLFKTTSIAIGGFADDIKTNIEKITGGKGIEGIKEKFQDVEDWIASKTGIELLPQEWIHRTQKSVDAYKHEAHRMKMLTSELDAALALFEPPEILTPNFDDDSIKAQVQGFFESIENAFNAADLDLPKFNIDLGAGGAGAAVEKAKQDISALKSLWGGYYQTEAQRNETWYKEQQQKYADNKTALRFIDDIYEAKKAEIQEKEIADETAKLQTIRDLHTEQFATGLEKLQEWYDQQVELYSGHKEALALIDAIYVDRKTEEEKEQERKIQVEKEKAWQRGLTVARAFGKKGFKLAQGISIAQATMNSYEAATKAFATVPYPYNYAAMALALAAGLAQVAQIAAQKPPAAHSGLTNVPREGVYTLAPRERVVSAPQNKDLTEFIAKGGGGPSIENLNVYINAPTPIQDMNRNDWEDVAEDYIVPAFSNLARLGIKP